jgi:hypothetical protein
VPFIDDDDDDYDDEEDDGSSFIAACGVMVQLENVQLRLVSFSAEPGNGVWTKDSNFMVDYSFVNDGETATELEWGDQLYLSTTPDLSGTHRILSTAHAHHRTRPPPHTLAVREVF